MEVNNPNMNSSMNIDISKTTSVSCEKCDSKIFQQAIEIRKMSALISPSGQETLIPVAAFACEKCGHVNSDFADVDGIE